MLSPRAEKMINNYFNLPFPGLAGVRTPYFNNARGNLRGQLRVLVGKGTPAEIVDEAHIISIQYHAGLFEKNGACCLHLEHTGAPVTPDDMRAFLIKYNLGIECSGFVTNVLREHFRETKHFDVTKKLHIISPRHIARWLIARLRPVENISVRTYTDTRNTAVIEKITDAKPGDLITMLETGPTKKRNHILLITGVTCHSDRASQRAEESLRGVRSDSSTAAAASARNDSTSDDCVIEYVHARAWSSEGALGHGVSRGTITITKPTGGLLEQTWTEKDLVNEQNETYREAKNATKLELRRVTV